jgi:hypothetical protein
VEEGVFRAALAQVKPPAFVPRKGVKIQTKEDAATKVEQSVLASLSSINHSFLVSPHGALLVDPL